MTRCTWAGSTHVGRIRAQNEDAVWPEGVREGEPPIVVAVADGIGGQPHGEVASRVAIEAVGAADPSMRADEIVASAHDAITTYISDHLDETPDLMLMGTTLTVAVVRPGPSVDIGHVGDSRAYAFARGRLLTLTEDHTVAMDLVRQGRLDPDSAEHDPRWHVISNWIGVEMRRIETLTLGLEAGDRLLLCTDGLSNLVDHVEIARLLEQAPDDPDAVDSLIAAANGAGGSDNTSVVVLTVQTD